MGTQAVYLCLFPRGGGNVREQEEWTGKRVVSFLLLLPLMVFFFLLLPPPSLSSAAACCLEMSLWCGGVGTTTLRGV